MLCARGDVVLKQRLNISVSRNGLAVVKMTVDFNDYFWVSEAFFNSIHRQYVNA